MANSLHTPAGSLRVHHFGDGAVQHVALHGFTLTGASMASLGAHLDGVTLAPDLPGHGETSLVEVDLAATKTALVTLLSALDVPPILIGYSQGGRIAAHVASDRPDVIQGLVMISATCGLRDRARRERRRSDEKTARDIESLGVSAFLDDWLVRPLTATTGLPEDVAAWDRKIRTGNTSGGLAAAVRGLGQGALPRVDATSLNMATMWMAGGADETYAATMRMEAVRAGGRFVLIPDVGHNVVLEQPAVVAEYITAWAETLL